MRLFTIFLTLLLALTACGPLATSSAPETTQADPASVPVEPTTVPADNPTSESPASAISTAFETSLLATEWKGKSEGNVLFPLHPVSGEALPSYTPISLGQSSYHAFSPDQHTLAVVIFPTGSTSNGSLLLIDLPAWKTQRIELELVGWVSNMVFSPDGKQLAIAHGESNHKLTIFNIQQGVITSQGNTDSYVSRLKFTESGKELMLYSPAVDTTNGLSAGPPEILLLDAADLSPRWSAELENVHDGIFPKDKNVTPSNIHEPGQAFYMSPGLVFAPDRDVLYVVHADSDQLTTVDFGAQQIETVKIQTHLTWFERLLSLTAGVAHAKIADGTNKQAAVSPDGKFLYVVGVNNSSFQDKQGNWQMEQTPLGLEIIQTSDGSRVERIENDATEISLSPDGRFLYLRNWGQKSPWTEIYDMANQQVTTHKEWIFAMPAMRINGEYLLVSTVSTDEYTHHMRVLEPDGSKVLSEWTVSGENYVYWLTMP
jgi:DNA-binding beta-propeller fold protein YncE